MKQVKHFSVKIIFKLLLGLGLLDYVISLVSYFLVVELI